MFPSKVWFLAATGNLFLAPNPQSFYPGAIEGFCFDQSAEGMAKGEGIANLVLEREEARAQSSHGLGLRV